MNNDKKRKKEKKKNNNKNNQPLRLYDILLVYSLASSTSGYLALSSIVIVSFSSTSKLESCLESMFKELAVELKSLSKELDIEGDQSFFVVAINFFILSYSTMMVVSTTSYYIFFFFKGYSLSLISRKTRHSLVKSSS